MTPKSGYTRRNNLLEKLEERRSRMKSETETLQALFAQCVEKQDTPQDEHVYLIGALPIVAGTFDKFDIEYIVDLIIPKTGPNARIGNGGLFKAMAIQVPATGFSSLSKTAEFLTKVDTNVVLGPGVMPEDINRHALSRFLDAVADYGPMRFFHQVAAHIMSNLEKKVTAVHLDSTSVHFHGSPNENEEGNIAITFGYSRDGHPELPQIIVLGLADHETGLPVSFKGVSGNENDKQSFLTLLEKDADEFKKEFPDVKIVVGDSALCTANIFEAASRADVHLITKMPLTNSVARQYIAEADPEKFTNIYGSENTKSERGQWCPNLKIGSCEVKTLLVENPALREKNRKKYEREAKKEAEKAMKELSSLTRNCTNMEEAKAAADKVQKSLKLCRMESISHEEQWKNCKVGRPRNDEEPEKKLVGIKVTATIVADEELITKKTELSIRYVIVTSDLATSWTMSDLLTMYRGQKHIESGWKLFKDKRLMLESIYLEKPERIEALMCILYLIVLFLKVAEIVLREGMEKNSLELPPVANEAPAARPTITRLIDYVVNQHITLYKNGSGEVRIFNVNNTLFNIFLAMGAHWLRYYLPQTYGDNRPSEIAGK